MSKKVHAIKQDLRVTLADDEDPVAEALAWGIKHSAQQFQLVERPPILIPDHYRAYSKITVERYLCPGPREMTFKEESPLVYRDLRARFGISEEYYVDIFQKKLRQLELEREDPWYNTEDDRNIVKCMGKEEHKELQKSLPDYRDYIVQHAKETLLPKLMGVYLLTIEDTEKKTHLLVMRNHLGGFPIEEKYDLKGVKGDRAAASTGKARAFSVQTDKEFADRQRKLYLTPDDRQRLLADLQRDLDWLQAQHRIDYSLLLGIWPVPEGTETADLALANQGLSYNLFSAPGHSPREMYFIGLVDTLTHYGARKAAAHGAQAVKLKSGASTATPSHYAKRSYEYVDSIIATGAR